MSAKLKAKPVNVINTTAQTISDNKNAKLFTLLAAIGLLPFLLSDTTYDTNVPLRFTFLGCFVLLFILYFFIINNTVFTVKWTLLPKVFFGCSVLFGVWSCVPLAYTYNSQELLFVVSRHFLALLFLFIIIHTLQKSEHFFITLSKAFTIIAILQAVVGIAQFYNSGFESIQGDMAKPVGLMGNRNFFGSAQMLLLPFAIIVGYSCTNWWRKASVVAIAMLLFSIIISQTRSAWLATAIMLLVATILIVVFFKSVVKLWSIAVAAIVAVSIILFFIISATSTQISFKSSIQDRMELSLNEPTANIINSSANERLVMWQLTLQTIMDKPIAGVGAGNWKLAVLQHVTKESPYANGKTIPQFAHNEYLQTAAETGLVGLLLLLISWAIVMVMCIKNIQQAKTNNTRCIQIMLASGLLAFASDCMFSFPLQRMEHLVYVLIMAGAVISQYCSNYKSVPSNIKSRLLFVPLTLVAVFITVVGFNKINYEKHFVLAKTSFATKDYETIFNEVAAAKKNTLVTIAPNALPIEIYEGLAQKDLKKLDLALTAFNNGLAYNPYSSALYVNIGAVYTDLKKFDTAIIYYKKALQYAPSSSLAYANMAINYYNINQWDSCLTYIKKAAMPTDKNMQNLEMLAQQAKLYKPVTPK